MWPAAIPLIASSVLGHPAPARGVASLFKKRSQPEPADDSDPSPSSRRARRHEPAPRVSYEQPQVRSMARSFRRSRLPKVGVARRKPAVLARRRPIGRSRSSAVRAFTPQTGMIAKAGGGSQWARHRVRSSPQLKAAVRSVMQEGKSSIGFTQVIPLVSAVGWDRPPCVTLGQGVNSLVYAGFPSALAFPAPNNVADANEIIVENSRLMFSVQFQTPAPSASAAGSGPRSQQSRPVRLRWAVVSCRRGQALTTTIPTATNIFGYPVTGGVLGSEVQDYTFFRNWTPAAYKFAWERASPEKPTPFVIHEYGHADILPVTVVTADQFSLVDVNGSGNVGGAFGTFGTGPSISATGIYDLTLDVAKHFEKGKCVWPTGTTVLAGTLPSSVMPWVVFGWECPNDATADGVRFCYSYRQEFVYSQ